MKRFLHLESERPEREHDAQRPLTTRFEPEALPSAPLADDPLTDLALARPPARGAAPAPLIPDDAIANRLPPEAYAPLPTHTAARFAPDAPSLALSERDRETLPFRRCADCGVDSHRFATACQHCGADLETSAQRAFMQQLAEDAAREKAAEAEQSAAFAAARSEAAMSQQQANRAWAEALASSTRQRVERELGDEPEHGFWSEPLGKKLLRRLPPKARTPTVIGAIVIPLALVFLGSATHTRGVLRVGWTLLAVVGALFFSPRDWLYGNRWGRRNRW